MKKLLILLFSLFFLSSHSVVAKDISDFQIEGISIGDSLLDYMTEHEILKGIEKTKERFHHLNEPYKFAQILLTKEFLTYDGMSVYIKNNSTNQYITDKTEKYTIDSLAGGIHYIEDFDGCKQKRGEIVEILSGMFPNADKSELITFDYDPDPSGESFGEGMKFLFPSGMEVQLQCINIEESLRIEKNWSEGLFIVIYSKEIISWMSNKK